MAPIDEDDWSDSDDEVLAEVETSVTLGVPDGLITTAGDLADAAVSRIGGLPVCTISCTMTYLFILPRHSSSRLNHPSPRRSARYVVDPWNCLCKCGVRLRTVPWTERCTSGGALSPHARKKTGGEFGVYFLGRHSISPQRLRSIRAWRGLRFNAEYAAKLEKKLAKRKEREDAKKPLPPKTTPAANPFSVSCLPFPFDLFADDTQMGAGSAPNPFGFGDQVFGEPVAVPKEEAVATDDAVDDESDSESTSSEQSLITALTSATLEDSPWTAAPRYSAQYLSTSPEYITPEPKRKVPTGEEILAGEQDGKDSKGAPWTAEAYENSLDIDQVFEKFSKRVEYEPEQCVRYDLNGTPLPFSQGDAFDTIFPPPPPENLPVTKAEFKVVRNAKRTYSTTHIPRCPSCGANRVFECQLMPNLINILKDKDQDASLKKMTDDERRKAVELALKGGDGMGWGTAMVFSCEKDCCTGKDAWREEHVLIQWDI